MSFRKSLITRFVAFPDYIKTGIVALFVWVFAWLFGMLVTAVPFLAFLSPYIPGVAAAAAAAVIAWMQNAVPDKFGDVATQAIKLILMLLAIFGIGGQVALLWGAHLAFAF